MAGAKGTCVTSFLVRRLIPIVAAVVLLSAILMLVADTRLDASGSPDTIADTENERPWFSASRIPDGIEAVYVAGRIGGTLPAKFQGEQTCVVANSAFGEVLAHRPDAPLIPASTLKVATSLAAWKVLGPDYRFSTEVRVPAPPIDGTVSALVLVGGGDPTLTTVEYEAVRDFDDKGRSVTLLDDLADSIVAQGVTTVDGPLVVQDGRHSTERFLSDRWKADYADQGSVGPLGALVVNDGWASFDPRWVRAEDPALVAGNELARKLVDRGVTFTGSIEHDPGFDAGTVLTGIQSPPLRDILVDVLSFSDNHAAEQIVRELAATDATSGATTDQGTAVVIEALQGLGIDTAGAVIRDGSGLSRDDRLTCRLLSQALSVAQTPEFDGFIEAMSVPGERGTLSRVRPDGITDVRAKTGTLQDVSSLAAVAAGGSTAAWISNEPLDGVSAHDLQDELTRWLIGLDKLTPELAVLAPGEPEPTTTTQPQPVNNPETTTTAATDNPANTPTVATTPPAPTPAVPAPGATSPPATTPVAPPVSPTPSPEVPEPTVVTPAPPDVVPPPAGEPPAVAAPVDPAQGPG